MARTITLGQVVLTKLRGYRWEIASGVDTEGNPRLVVTEVYVVTDDAYSTAPEGQKRVEVALTTTERDALNKAFRKYLTAATQREQVEAE